MKKKLAFIGVPVALVASIFIYQNYADENKAAAANQENDTNVLLVSNDFDTTSNLDDMVNSADLVVVGKYTNLDTTWNMARDPENPEKESTDQYTEGRLFNFNVEKTLKGNVEEDSLRINHLYSETYKIEETSGDEIISPEGIILKEPTEKTVHEVEKVDPLFIEPTIGEKYILFLDKGEDTGNYYGSIEPFSILFDDNNVGELQSNLIGLEHTTADADHNHSHDERFTETVTVGEQSIDITHDIHTTIEDNLTGESLDTIINEIESIVE